MEIEPIAEVCAEQGYDGLHQAFRARAEQLKIARDQIDELASLARGHASKLLAPYPMRAIGRTTLGPLLYALKLKIVVVPDDDVVWREQPRARDDSQARNGQSLTTGAGNLPEMRFLSKKIIAQEMKKRQRNGAIKGNASRTPEQRSKIVRKAWRTRRRLERERRLATRCAPGRTVANSSLR